MRPPIGFKGPGHQTPARFPTADARILLVIPSGQTQCIFRLRGEKFRECRYRNRPRPSDGHTVLCDMQYFHLHISPNYDNIAFVTSFYHNVFLKRGDRI